jgi:DNA-binding PucR family transcriptional regulator
MLQRLRTAAGSGRSPTRGPVAELIRYDDEHGTPFVATLRAWLEAQGDASQTAIRLGVHENTVRNRLRKMLEVAPLDLDDPHKRLAMVIQLATVAPPQNPSI